MEKSKLKEDLEKLVKKGLKKVTVHRVSDKIKDAFKEAYDTHTSTSPNYQIIASLDLARKQVDLEGFKIVSANYLKDLSKRPKSGG